MTSWNRILIYRRLAAISAFRRYEAALGMFMFCVLLSKFLA